MRKLIQSLCLGVLVVSVQNSEARPPNPTEYERVKAAANLFQNDVINLYNFSYNFVRFPAPVEQQALSYFYRFANETVSFNRLVQYAPTTAEQTEVPLKNLNLIFKAAQDMFPALSAYRFYVPNFNRLQDELAQMSNNYDVVTPRLWNPSDVMQLALQAAQSFMSVRTEMEKASTTDDQRQVVSRLQNVEVICWNLRQQVMAYPANPVFSRGIFNELKAHMDLVKDQLAVAGFAPTLNALFWESAHSADVLEAYY